MWGAAKTKIGATRQKEPMSRCNLSHTSSIASMRSPMRPVSTCLVKNPQRSKGGMWGGCKNKDRCYKSDGAHKSIKAVTYLGYSLHTLANTPGLDIFGPESTEIE